MLEPLLMLTVLNCFFMFSSTVTTCALWWQYRRHRRNCPSHGNSASKVKKSKSYGAKIAKDDGKTITNDNVDNTGSKLTMRKRDKTSKKNKKATFLGPQDVSEEIGDTERKTMEKLTSTEELRRGATSPSSEAKSTIVMEVSTTQKVMQIFDKDRDYHGRVVPSKETLTYRLSPDNERKVEFIIKDKSAEKTRSVEKNRSVEDD